MQPYLQSLSALEESPICVCLCICAVSSCRVGRKTRALHLYFQPLFLTLTPTRQEGELSGWRAAWCGGGCPTELPRFILTLMPPTQLMGSTRQVAPQYLTPRHIPRQNIWIFTCNKRKVKEQLAAAAFFECISTDMSLPSFWVCSYLAAACPELALLVRNEALKALFSPAQEGWGHLMGWDPPATLNKPINKDTLQKFKMQRRAQQQTVVTVNRYWEKLEKEAVIFIEGHSTPSLGAGCFTKRHIGVALCLCGHSCRAKPQAGRFLGYVTHVPADNDQQPWCISVCIAKWFCLENRLENVFQDVPDILMLISQPKPPMWCPMWYQ